MSSHGKISQEVDNLSTLEGLRPAGALVAPLGRSSDREALDRFCANVPTVLFDSNLEGIGQAFVGSDNASFVNEIVTYLCETGQPPCLFEMRTPPNPNANKRRLAYVSVMQALGHEPHVVPICGEGWAFEEIGRAGGHSALEEGLFPSRTILCSNDRLAIGLLSACYEKGLRVGRTEGCALRVASMDDHPFAKFTCPSLTTAAHNYAEVAELSVQTLFGFIDGDGERVERTETFVPARLIKRASA